MFRTISNYFLCLKFPFLRLKNAWTEEAHGFSSTWYDKLPQGWKNTFGKQLCIDLKEALKLDNKLSDFSIISLRTINGKLNISHNDEIGEETEKVISFYENVSIVYCASCGRPVRYKTRGWIEYYCENCILPFVSRDEKVSDYRLKIADIPKPMFFNPELEQQFKRFNWINLWDLKE